jgi:hypothetical protein
MHSIDLPIILSSLVVITKGSEADGLGMEPTEVLLWYFFLATISFEVGLLADSTLMMLLNDDESIIWSENSGIGIIDCPLKNDVVEADGLTECSLLMSGGLFLLAESFLVRSVANDDARESVFF